MEREEKRGEVLRGRTCRLFVGTWPDGQVQRDDIIRTFSQYGRIVEDIVYKGNYAFLQLDTVEGAVNAVDRENGKPLGLAPSISKYIFV